MSDFEITVVVNVHAENPKWIERCLEAITQQQDAPSHEIIIVADNPSEEITSFLTGKNSPVDARLLWVNNRDLGTSRNDAVKAAEGRYVAFCDGDDLWGNQWLRQAYDYARELYGTTKNFALHNELTAFFGQDFGFGQKPHLHWHIGDDSPEFDAKQLAQFNPWSALTFAPRDVLLAHPYFRATGAYGYEDYEWAARTLNAGVKHRVVPSSMHAVRLKADQTSMATRNVRNGLVIPKMDLFDRRDLPDAKPIESGKQITLAQSQIDQVLALHNEVGEYQLILAPDSPMRQYPVARTFPAQAMLRDAIGDAKHVVLVEELRKGGAEKYAIDWAVALGAVIVETAPIESPWLARARLAGVRVVRFQQPNLNEQEQAMAIQRALIQAQLESVLVCNSMQGLVLVNENAECLAGRVFVASFATIPVGNGFQSCPPFWFSRWPSNLSIITDNDSQALKIQSYNEAPVVVIPPKCDYAGDSKLSRIEKKRVRVLWAGRGSPDKQPQLLPAIAALLEDKADIHVWGDVQPLNGPENLKYRGPFDGFENIDGVYDVYLMTSMNEGMPNTAMEATLADLQVVGPAVGGLPLIASRLYANDTPQEIARAIMLAVTEGPAQVRDPKETIHHWRDTFASSVQLTVGSAS